MLFWRQKSGIEQSENDDRQEHRQQDGQFTNAEQASWRGHDSSGKASRAFFTTGCMVAAGGESCQAGEDVGSGTACRTPAGLSGTVNESCQRTRSPPPPRDREPACPAR